MNRKYICIDYFLYLIANLRILPIESKLLPLGKLLLREILFYIVCAGGSDIDRRRYGWDNLLRKYRIVKERGGENLAVSYIDRNKLVIDIFGRAKK